MGKSTTDYVVHIDDLLILAALNYDEYLQLPENAIDLINQLNRTPRGKGGGNNQKQNMTPKGARQYKHIKQTEERQHQFQSQKGW